MTVPSFRKTWTASHPPQAGHCRPPCRVKPGPHLDLCGGDTAQLWGSGDWTWVREAVSGHSQPHPCLAIAPSPPAGSQKGYAECLTVLPASVLSWAHSQWGWGGMRGLALAGQKDKECGPHLRGALTGCTLGWTTLGCHPVRQPLPHTSLLPVLVTSFCLVWPGAGKGSQLPEGPRSCTLPCGLPILPTTVPRDSSQVIRT